jgi:hypothetical protein
MSILKLKLNLARIVVTFLNKAYLSVNVDKGWVEQWTRLILQRVETRGPVDTVGWIKAIRLACTRYMCGQPLKESPGFGVQLDESGLPRAAALPFVSLFREMSRPNLRFALTLLGFVRLIDGSKAPDLDPITLPASPYPSVLDEEIPAIVKSLNWRLSVPEWERPHVTTKSGPNAQALIGSIEDASLLTETQLANLRLCGGEKLVQTIGAIRSLSVPTWCELVGITPKGCLSRLSYIKDKEAKCRIVAILDYWTQSCFEPLHKAQFALLRSLKPDCTFNQGSFRSKLPRQGPYYSCDLSSATDRLPVTLQRAVLAVLISPEYAAAWYELLCTREYKLPKGAGSVKYGAGQPMGAYSSWTTFAITHHAIVRLAAKRAGLPITWEGYVLLGDDIVLANEHVAKEYMTILDSLGVKVSETKTHVSNDTYEFAKRWIHSGEEVTGAPLGSLFEAIRFVNKNSWKNAVVPTALIKHISYYEVATWFREVESRWLPRTSSLVSRGLLARFFLLLGRGGLSDRLAEKAWKFFLLPSREDSRLLRRIKCDKLGSIVLGGILGCFQFRKASEFIGIYLNECKARVLENAIKRQVGELSRFQLELQRFAPLVPEGLDAQSTLFALPPFGVLIRNISELQLEFDKAHRVRESDNLMHWLHLDVQLFLDPFATLSTRRNKTIASSKATILNHLTAMCRGIARMRALAVTEIDLLDLVNVINNYHVLPSRGDRRRSKKTGGGYKISRSDPRKEDLIDKSISVRRKS